eukprot:scaffold33619_cov67-Phaeocystis_antarctica.AAC.2
MCLSSPCAFRAALQKPLLKCAFETSSASGFPCVSARITRSSLGNSARRSPTSTKLSRRTRPTSARVSGSSGVWVMSALSASTRTKLRSHGGLRRIAKLLSLSRGDYG